MNYVFLKRFWFISLLIFSVSFVVSAQKRVYDITLFGRKIGTTVVERIAKENGEVQYKLTSSSEVNILFANKTSSMFFDILYKDGRLISSYCKNVKDGVTEIVTMVWDGTQYIVKKGEEILHLKQPLDFSAVQLYFTEPVNRTTIFSERMGEFCNFVMNSTGVYECKLATGVNNIYRYKNGVLYELEMSKGPSVFMKLVQ